MIKFKPEILLYLKRKKKILPKLKEWSNDGGLSAL